MYQSVAYVSTVFVNGVNKKINGISHYLITNITKDHDWNPLNNISHGSRLSCDTIGYIQQQKSALLNKPDNSHSKL